MEPNLKESLQTRNKSLDEFFCVKSLLLEEKKKKKGDGDSDSNSGDDEVPQGESLNYALKEGVRMDIFVKKYFLFYKVFCSDTNQLVLEILNHRGMDPQTSDVHVGIDGGQNMLKLGITITDKQESTKTGRSLYSQVKNDKNNKLKKT